MTDQKPVSVASQISFRTKLFFLLVGALIAQLIAHKMSDRNDEKRETKARALISTIVAEENSHRQKTGAFTADLPSVGFTDLKLPDIHFYTETATLPEALKARMKPTEFPEITADQFRLVTAYTCDGNEYGCLLIADGLTTSKRIIEVK